MQLIAREFNFSETVFLQQDKKDESLHIRIFTPVNEMDFAGHPIIGAGHVIFRRLIPMFSLGQPLPANVKIQTIAGPVAIHYEEDGHIVSAEVPHKVYMHSKGTPRENIVATQPNLSAMAVAMNDTYPAVSIVRGVTYTLVNFTEQPELFAAVSAGASQATELDDGWGPSFTGTMYYRALDSCTEHGRYVQRLRVRMIAINLEDPACGSGSCALGAYLALQHGEAYGRYRFYIDQGREIGRDSNIIVDVVLNSCGDGISAILLSGPAVPVAEGTMLLSE